MNKFEKEREQQIAERCDQMPKSYRANYRKALEGRSLRAVVNASCLECVCWRIEEIRQCTDLGCPKYAVRPYQHSSQNGRDGYSGGAERPNAA